MDTKATKANGEGHLHQAPKQVMTTVAKVNDHCSDDGRNVEWSMVHSNWGFLSEELIADDTIGNDEGLVSTLMKLHIKRVFIMNIMMMNIHLKGLYLAGDCKGQQSLQQQ